MKLRLSTRVIVVVAFLGGLGSLAAVTPEAGELVHMSATSTYFTVAMCTLLIGMWVWPLVLFRETGSQAFHMDEALFVVLVLLVPPVATVMAFAVATTVSQLIRRRALAKSAFNFGTAMIAVGAGLAVSRSIATPGRPMTIAAVGGALAGALVHFVVGTVAASGVVVSTGSSWREPLRDSAVQVKLAAVGSLVGCLVAMAAGAHFWALCLAVPVLVVIRMVLSAQFEAQHDRARMQGLFTLTLQANRGLSQDGALETILGSAREQLRCPTAEIVSERPGSAQMAAPVETGSEQKWLVVSGRRREEPFDHADRILLDAIAAISEGALANAELYRQVRYERERLASITLNIGEGVCAVDVNGDLTFANPAAIAMVDLAALSGEGASALPPGSVKAPDFLMGPARKAMESQGGVREDEANFPRRDGQLLPVEFTASAARHNGRVVGAVISFRDITGRKKLEAEMTHQAMHDSLTGLANRRKLVDRLETALNRSATDRAPHALIFVDVDRFKAINDSLGHGTGDELLVAVGARMAAVLGGRGLLSRFGGDEFVVLIEDLSGVDEAESFARKFCSAVEEPVVLSDGYEIVVSISIGIAITGPDQTADDILRDADVAMYTAKGRGGSYQIFDKKVMGTRSSARIDLEAALRKALDRGELEVHYQPLFWVQDMTVAGAEALVRWRHPTDGLVPPDRFIPMAEETGLVVPLGKFVLDQACRQARTLRDRLGTDIPISVNLSPRQFQHNSLLSDVATALDREGIPSDLITFEITENMVMDDLVGAGEIMKKLNRLGVRLSIDDFGTGHSSLGYLKQFPIHEVKVDRSFIKGLPSDPVDAAIIRAVVYLSEAMRITAVAEGVETEEQLAELRALGCDKAQGFFFSPPLARPDFDALVERALGRPPLALDRILGPKVGTAIGTSLPHGTEPASGSPSRLGARGASLGAAAGGQ